MKNILVLIDFTPSCLKAVDQAIELAKFKSAKITLCHITHFDQQGIQEKFAPYKTQLEASGLSYSIHIGIGEFKKEVSNMVINDTADLVIASSHGKHGLKETLFGSNIYDLIKSLHCTILVLNDKSPVVSGGYKRILLPVSPHANFLLKVEQSCEVLAKHGEIVIFNIVKPGVEVSEEVAHNVNEAKNILDRKGVNYVYEQLDSVKFSIGYSKETLDYIQNNEVDLIAIMAKTSDVTSGVFNDIDKENILLNELGIPVLCANS